MVRASSQRTGFYFVLCCGSERIYFYIIVYIGFVELIVWNIHQNIRLFLNFHQCFYCCVQMADRFVYSCLGLRCFQLIFCFLQFSLHGCPAVRSIIRLCQRFCFLNCSFQFVCSYFFFFFFHDILICCLELIGYILISQCGNRNGPVSGSICSFRQGASQ